MGRRALAEGCVPLTTLALRKGRWSWSRECPCGPGGSLQGTPSLGYAAPLESRKGVCGDRALCLVAGLWVSRAKPWAATDWEPMAPYPHPCPPERPGLPSLVLGSLAGCLCDFREGVLRLWSLPGLPLWSVHGVGPREGKVWAFWGRAHCSPFQIPEIRHVVSSEGVGRLLRQASWSVGPQTCFLCQHDCLSLRRDSSGRCLQS